MTTSATLAAARTTDAPRAKRRSQPLTRSTREAEGEEGEPQTQAVDRKQQHSLPEPRSRTCERQDRAQNGAYAGRPGDREGRAEGRRGPELAAGPPLAPIAAVRE